MVDQPPERNQVEYVYQNQTIIGHRVQTATAPTANSHAEKETYKTNPNIEPQASSPRSSPLPAGCLAVHWRCLGKKVRTRVGAEIPTRLADPLHRYIPTRLADPMPIFNPQSTNFPGVMGTEARVSNGFKGSQWFGHQQGFPPVESDFCRYCLQSSQYQTLSYSKAHTHTKKKDSSHQIKFFQMFPCDLSTDLLTRGMAKSSLESSSPRWLTLSLARCVIFIFSLFFWQRWGQWWWISGWNGVPYLHTHLHVDVPSILMLHNWYLGEYITITYIYIYHIQCCTYKYYCI